MKHNKRIVVSLLLDGKDLVKGERFANHRYIGDPLNTIKIFSDKQVDELCLIQLNNENAINLDYLRHLGEEAKMPLTYGGGLTCIKSSLSVINLGFEKLLFHSALYQNPKLLNDLSKKIGAQSISVSINVRKIYGVYKACCGLNPVNDLIEFLSQIKHLGCGEVIINNIDLEGTDKGPDLELAEFVSAQLTVPVLYGGGIASLDHIENLLNIPTLSGVLVGNYFTYSGPLKAVLPSYLYDS